MGYARSIYEKLQWHKTFAFRPRIIGKEIVWLTHFYRKGKLVDGRGDHIGGTMIKYAWYHTKEEHFNWLLTGEEDEIIDETFRRRMKDRRNAIMSGLKSPPLPRPPPPPPPPRRLGP